MQSFEEFTDADVQSMLVRALRLLGVLTVLGMFLAWWKMGWKSSLLLLLGSVISGSGLWEWMRLIRAVLERMEAGRTPKPIARVLIGFFLRLAAAIAVLYISVKYLNGSVAALAVGLGLGIVSLASEAIRMARAWTV
ncbi:MAG: ATP synthase subunit I [Acidobacteriaceae bacterium]